MRWFRKIKNLFKKKKIIKFPAYPKINIDDIEDMSIILEAGSNKLTRWGMRYLHGWKYDLTFTHSFLHIELGYCLNMTTTAHTTDIKNLLKKSHRYIVISFGDVDGKMATRGKRASHKRAGDIRYKYRLYDIRGFLYQGFKKIPVLKRLIKPSKRLNICSDLVADIYKYEMKHPLFVNVDDEDVTPTDLYIIAESYQATKIYELII
ncbi:hypothetical protein LCGC14_3039150 [marine sediment metagenome]|uniref:Uncharacterized protein n=1 Tax=marine sediment metagenome TaxID=412755 RepID=A0A0F8WQQ2_9ZZZZ